MTPATTGGSVQQGEQLVSGQGGRTIRTTHRSLSQGSLAILEQEDALLYGALSDQSVDNDRAILTDTMGTVGSLILDCRVPPGIDEKDVIGSGEVQSGAASLERDEEHRRSLV